MAVRAGPARVRGQTCAGAQVNIICSMDMTAIVTATRAGLVRVTTSDGKAAEKGETWPADDEGTE